MKARLLLIKHSDEVGSIAIDTSLFKNLRDIYGYLSSESLGSLIQVVIVQGIESYQEYYPVKYMNDTTEFIITALTRIKDTKK